MPVLSYVACPGGWFSTFVSVLGGGHPLGQERRQKAVSEGTGDDPQCRVGQLRAGASVSIFVEYVEGLGDM